MEFTKAVLFFFGGGLIYYYFYYKPMDNIRIKYSGNKRKVIDNIIFKQNWSFFMNEASFELLKEHFNVLEILEIKKVMISRKKKMFLALFIFLLVYSVIL